MILRVKVYAICIFTNLARFTLYIRAETRVIPWILPFQKDRLGSTDEGFWWMVM
jgi:hypothetical protein